ncbi:TadE/TadG family type IV pilus assembly protein [Aeoliella mucimassa]|uniref:TadE-like protein n=1 Tax=Aeoliella mucimassa TaxID=2527972 RepID=A0A518AV64_9BACT|nr:TadE family protein [Aeoliella mucimassa]QDU58602.1 TadE-like protein [Aeoliella mucimassa]
MIRRKNRNSKKRRGVAATEFAVCLPIIMLIMLGMIETCSMIFLKQSLAIAAYEGSHTAVKPGATTAEVAATCQGILNDRNISGATIQVLPKDIEKLNVGEYMTIQVTAPSSQNAVVPVKFFRGSTIQASAVMMKEI